MTDGTQAGGGGGRGALLRRGLVIVALGLAFALFTGVFRGGLLPVGEPAPGWRLPRADGSGELLGSDELDGKVVVLDFWSTTCPPCMRQMKDLDVVWRRFKPRGVRVMGVAAGGESLARVEQFGRDKNVDYPLVLDDGVMSVAHKVMSLPSIYVIGRDGKIAATHQGYWPGDELTEAIEKALAR